MKLTFTAAELTAIRQTNLKIARLLSELPGTEFIVSQLREQADTPIDPHKIMLDLDSSQVEIYWANDAGDLTIWINPEAVSEALDLVVSQYSIVVEIGVALYPVLRLAKRLVTDFTDKLVSFGERFARKPNRLLGANVPVKFGGWMGVPVRWEQGIVVAACGQTVIVQLSTSKRFIVAKQDGELFYAVSHKQEFERISAVIDSGAISDIPSWDFAE
jgi:hypothetical protein